MVDRIGQQLGNYRMLRLLGRGGFAEVYLGEHVHLNTMAAVKVLHTQLASDDLDGFRAEARTIARLEHPHIVRVLEFGIEGATPFLVMSYAPNGTLRQQYPKGSVLPLASIVSYVKQVADALQYAHDEKLIHRDIKPENMLLGRRNEVLLSDFGIALVAQSSRYQNTQEIIGTVAYMAPEQLQGKPRPASDQYALGIVVYEWLSGDRPFHGSFTEMYSQHMFVPPPPLREKFPEISPDIEMVILTALNKEPERRFLSVQAFATALEQVCASTPHYPLASPSQPLQPHMVGTPPDSSLPPTILPLSPIQQLQPTVAAPPRSLLSQPTVVVTQQNDSQASKHRLSRRMVLGGMAGLAIAGGSIAWTLLSSKRYPPQGTTLVTYRGHSSTISSVAWSPDGQYVASGSYENKVQVFDATTGKNILTYRGNANEVFAVAWSPNGKRIASAGGLNAENADGSLVPQDDSVQVWDALTGKNVLIYRGHSSWVENLVWSPDGTRIASIGTTEGTVKIWDAVNAQTLFTYEGQSNEIITSIAWSPNGQYIISTGYTGTGQSGTSQVWDVLTGANVLTIPNDLADVAWSPDSKNIVSTGNSKIQIWDASTGSLVKDLGNSSNAFVVAWSHDGKYLAFGGGDRSTNKFPIQVADATTGDHVFTYNGHSNYVFAIAWAPDDRRIASGSDDATVQIWEAV